MNHNYIFQGKNYISAKRASKISDYSSDYIGQLCRAGKLICQKVGHGWFVTEESLRDHMATVVSEDALATRINNINGKGSGSVVDERVVRSEPERISAKRASLMSGYNTDYIGQLCRGGKLDGRLIGKAWFITKDSLKAHIEKISAELKAASAASAAKIAAAVAEKDEAVRRAQSNISDPIVPTVERATELTKLESTMSRTIPELTRRIILQRVLTAAVVFVVVIGAFTISFVPGASRLASSLIHNERQVAMSIASPAGSLSGNTGSGASAETSAYNGLAVAPSSGSTATDEALKNDIRDSFSDPVNIDPDKSGTAGLITPVFRKATGKDFVYVMVPLKQASTSIGRARQ